MRHTVFRVLLTSIFVFCLSGIDAGLHGSLAEEALDGKSFNINLSEYGKSGDPSGDVLIFKDETMLSTECEQYGFGPGSYESVTKDGKILFEATTTSQKEGIIEWEGTVDGSKINGNFMWSKPGQDPVLYTYSGSIKQ